MTLLLFECLYHIQSYCNKYILFQGLMTPIVRNADQKSISAISSEVLCCHAFSFVVIELHRLVLFFRSFFFFPPHLGLKDSKYNVRHESLNMYLPMIFHIG